MKKGKFIVVFSKVFLTAAVLLIALAACSDPSGNDGKAVFTINLGDTGRMAYPPNTPNSFPVFSDLTYELSFASTTIQYTKTFKGDLSSNKITGTIDAGVYNVSLKIYLKADNYLYALDDETHGPATINPNPNNTIPMQMVKYESGEVEGTEGNPFRVYDVETLKKVGSGNDGWSQSAHYRQMRDITLPNVTSGESNNWTPIGNNSTRFEGIYDGNNKTISNLTQGLFGSIDLGATVQNVGIIDCDINSGNYGGSVVGINYGTVANCYATGEIRGFTNDSSVGGIVGYSNGMVQNCHFTGEVSGEGSLGGIVGNNNDYGTIQNCYAMNDIKGTDGSVGGVAGYNSGTVQNCHSTGTVSGTGSVGGVVGNNGGTVESCYATGKVSGNDSVGGVVGGNGGTVKSCYATGKVSGTNSVGGVVGSSMGMVQYCYATGDVEGDNGVGGVVGDNGSTLQYCYATGKVSGTYRVGGVAGYIGMNKVLNCYATGDVSAGSGDEVGGIVGGSAEGTVLNCYATGKVSGGDMVGGVVGNNAMAIAQNCVALNPNINGSEVGRVAVGSPAIKSYGRKDMTKGGNSFAWTDDMNGKDGADIEAAQWGVKSWWTTESNWDPSRGDVWDFTNDWEWGGSLPILRNMPSSTQNPSVKNN
jgi:hypothetical protein